MLLCVVITYMCIILFLGLLYRLSSTSPTQSRNIQTMLAQSSCTCHMLPSTPAPIPSKQIIKFSVGCTIFCLHTHWNAHKHTHGCEWYNRVLWAGWQPTGTLQHSSAPSPLIKYERAFHVLTFTHMHMHTLWYLLYTHIHSLYHFAYAQTHTHMHK